jgi:hypothetical protein
MPQHFRPYLRVGREPKFAGRWIIGANSAIAEVSEFLQLDRNQGIDILAKLKCADRGPTSLYSWREALYVIRIFRPVRIWGSLSGFAERGNRH